MDEMKGYIYKIGGVILRLGAGFDRKRRLCGGILLVLRETDQCEWKERVQYDSGGFIRCKEAVMRTWCSLLLLLDSWNLVIISVSTSSTYV